MQSCITNRLRCGVTTSRTQARLGCSTARRRFQVRAAYDVEVDSDPVRAPNSGPGRWGAPPPPPPPPPPSKQSGFQMPSRREALFAFLGAGLGVAGTAVYYNNVTEISEETAEGVIEKIVNDDELMDKLSEVILYDQFQTAMDSANEELDRLRNDMLSKAIDGSNAQQP